MSFSRAFQWYHSHLDPIWPDGTFKGKRHDIIIFFEGPKNQKSTFWISADGFHNYWLSFCGKNPLCLPLWNLLLIVKILPLTLFIKLFVAFWKPPMTLRDIPKAVCYPENFSVSRPRMYTGNKRPFRAKDCRNRNLIGLSEQSLNKYYQRSTQKIHIYFYP